MRMAREDDNDPNDGNIQGDNECGIKTVIPKRVIAM